MFTGWVGGGGDARVPAWLPSPESCTCFKKVLPLISSPSDAAKPRFLMKVIEMERNFLNAYRIFSLRGLMGVEYDSNAWLTEGFDLSIWSLVEEKPYYKRPKSHPVDCPISGQWTPRAGCKKQAHVHIPSSASSSLLAVAAQGLPGPEALFVGLCLTAHGGLFFCELD